MTLAALVVLMVGSACAGEEAAPEAPPAERPAATAATAAPAATAVPADARPPVLEAAPATPDSVQVPEGMVYVPGGTTLIGNDYDVSGSEAARHQSDARPVFAAEVAPFFFDRHPVTVAAFGRFVEAEGFETQAERFGDAAVLDPRMRQWRLVPGATWQRPMGPEGPEAPSDHPVTQVSWNDAAAYCAWAGGRLPSEVEWEHAARGARNSRQPYAWGDTLRAASGQYKANIWQGQFPVRNAVADGYAYTSPVGAFGQTPLGLTDMGGNVWEWTTSWYRPYSERGARFTPTAESERVQRGGSFQCNECFGYRVYTRSHSTPETSLFHVGFRCARDVVE